MLTVQDILDIARPAAAHDSDIAALVRQLESDAEFAAAAVAVLNGVVADFQAEQAKKAAAEAAATVGATPAQAAQAVAEVAGSSGGARSEAPVPIEVDDAGPLTDRKAFTIIASLIPKLTALSPEEVSAVQDELLRVAQAA